MIDIQGFFRALHARWTAWWDRLSATQQLTVHGMAILIGVLALGAIAGASAPRSAIASREGGAYTGTAVRSQFRLLWQSLDTTAAELELTRLELQRLQSIVEVSKRYGVPTDLAETIYDAALREGIDPELAFRLVKFESEFNPRAMSRAGAVGLAQVQLPTARYYEPSVTLEQLYDPAVNLRIGMRFLRDLLTAYQDVELALLAYNWGPTRLKQLLAEGRDPRNAYASSIMKGYSSPAK